MDAPISRPATFVLDAEGIVRWRDLTGNFRLRIRNLGATPNEYRLWSN